MTKRWPMGAPGADGIAPYGVANAERRAVERALTEYKRERGPEEWEGLEVAVRDLLDRLTEHDEDTLTEGN